MPTLTANGIEIAYQIDGSGDETLVLVCGLGDAKESWAAAQLPAFTRKYRVITYDNRGIGASSAPPGPYTIQQMAGDLAGLVDGLGLDRFHLLGVSMGGMIAEEYAAAHADRLLSASFCCTSAVMGPFLRRVVALWREAAPRLGVPFTQRDVLLWCFTPEFFDTRPAELEEIEQALASTTQTVQGYLGQLDAVDAHDARARLGAITCPSMTLVGREDILIHPFLSRRLHDALPRSTWVEVPGGHACLWEHAEAFNEAVLGFLAGVPR